MKPLLVPLILLVVLLSGAFAFTRWQVECPHCHDGQVNQDGICEQGSNCPNYLQIVSWKEFSDQERHRFTGNPGHWKVAACPRCQTSGRMRRWDVWKD